MDFLEVFQCPKKQRKNTNANSFLMKELSVFQFRMRAKKPDGESRLSICQKLGSTHKVKE